MEMFKLVWMVWASDRRQPAVLLDVYSNRAAAEARAKDEEREVKGRKCLVDSWDVNE